jgi:uroporphyrinogen-III decarboxylase
MREDLANDPRVLDGRQQARRCIDTAARHSRYVLSTSCEIPPRSKPEIVQWFMDAAHEYGRYERVLG